MFTIIVLIAIAVYLYFRGIGKRIEAQCEKKSWIFDNTGFQYGVRSGQRKKVRTEEQEVWLENHKNLNERKDDSDMCRGVSGIISLVLIFGLLSSMTIDFYGELKVDEKIINQQKIINLVKSARGANDSIVHRSYQNLHLYEEKVELQNLKMKRWEERKSNAVGYGMFWRLW